MPRHAHLKQLTNITTWSSLLRMQQYAQHAAKTKGANATNGLTLATSFATSIRPLCLLASSRASLALSLFAQAQTVSQKPLTEVVTVATADFTTDSKWKVPMIAWGGDLQEIEANGGLTTQKGSIFDQKGLDRAS